MTHRSKHIDPSPPCPSLRQLAQHVADAAQLARCDREWIVDHLRECPTCCEMYGLLCDADETRQQLAEQGYIALLPASTPPADANSMASDSWVKVMNEQANAAQSLVPAAMEWFNSDLYHIYPDQHTKEINISQLLEKNLVY